jgi:uncharacterized protein (TIGR02001 family)
MMKTAIKPLALATAVSIASMAGMISTAQAEITGNVGVVSQYIFRGGVENDGPSVQGGLDWASDNGLYAGYWGSNLGYGDDDSNGFENDLYIGWGGGESFTWDIGFLYYAYLNVSDADTPELYGSIGFGPVTLGTTYTVDDSNWTNKGDMYWTLAANGDVAGGFTLGAKAGFYTYEKEGEFISSTSSSGFRDLDFSISHALGATGADMGLNYIVGGEDRDGGDIDDHITVSVSFGF